MATTLQVSRHGNQLFQVGAAYAQSLRMGEPCELPIDILDRHCGRCSLDAFFPNWKGRLVFKPAEQITYDNTHTEQCYHIIDIPAKPRLNMVGLFASTTAHTPYEQEVRDLFDCKPIIRDAVCVHVRRGDYVQLFAAKAYDLLGPDYYNRAMDILPYSRYMIVSDDITWCKQNLHRDGRNFCFVDTKDPLDDFRIGCGCKHFIIANSTFSWWMAYLGTHPDKQVIQPKHWWWPENNTPHLLHVPGWLVLDNRSLELVNAT